MLAYHKMLRLAKGDGERSKFGNEKIELLKLLGVGRLQNSAKFVDSRSGASHVQPPRPRVWQNPDRPDSQVSLTRHRSRIARPGSATAQIGCYSSCLCGHSKGQYA